MKEIPAMRKINYFDKAFELISVVAGIVIERTARFNGWKIFSIPFFKIPSGRNDSALEYLLFSLKGIFPPLDTRLIN